MAAGTQRTPFIRYAIAADLVMIAVAAAFFAPSSPAVPYLALFTAVVLAAWLSGDEGGLAATAVSVIVLAVFFPAHTDGGTLTAFAASGAAVSLFARAARHVQELDRAAAVPEPVAPERADALPVPVTAPAGALPFALGLPLLVVVLYADISDTIMRHYPVPSLLRPLILLLGVVVWRYHKVFRPLSAALRAPMVFFVLYAVVVFSTSVWASNAYEADARFSEVTKAVMICLVAASMAATWQALHRAFVALVVTAAAMATVSVIQITTGHFQNILGGMVKVKEGTIYAEVSMPRASGPPVNDPNFYARILLFAIPLAIALALNEQRPLRRLLYAGAAAVVTAATLLTYSRGAMLALAATALMMVATVGLRRRHLAAIAVCSVALLFVLPDEVEQRLLTVKSIAGADRGGRLDSSVEKRRILLGSGLGMFNDHLLTGVGAGNFNTYYAKYAARIGMSGIDYGIRGEHEFPHNLYLEIASETGLIGLASYGAIALSILLALWNTRRLLRRRGDTPHAVLASCVAAAIAGYLVASLFLHESHIRYFGLYVGFGIAVTRLAREQSALPVMTEEAA